MVPVITKSRDGGWVIYLRPVQAAAKRRMAETHGRQFDPIERQTVVGGIPEPMRRLPMVFATEADARASIKAAA